MDKLKLACLAGACAIAKNKRLEGTTYATTGIEKEISFYRAEILLRLFETCISEDGIDMDKLREYIENLDTYTIRRGD